MKKYLMFFSFPCLFLVPTLYVYQESVFGNSQCSSFENNCNGESTEHRKIRSNCETLISLLNATIPVLLIDVDFLTKLNKNKCDKQPDKPIKIGVDVKYLSTMSLLSDSRFEVIYYTNETGNDFLDFRLEPRRIIPKNLSTRSSGYFRIPVNIERFIGFWNRSRLIECMNLHIPRTGKTVRMPAIPSSNILAQLRDELIELGMFPFLNGGTLLGWYRECSVIPHTLDMDLSLFAESYNPEFLESLQKNVSIFRLSRKFGKVNDSFEMTVVPKENLKVFIDIFLMYKGIENGTVTHNWVGGVSPDGTKYKYTYPVYDPWCAAELHGHIFWVTCTPREKIVKEYGKLWYIDHLTSKYSWNSSGKNVKKNGKWTKEEMKEVYKVFKGR